MTKIEGWLLKKVKIFRSAKKRKFKLKNFGMLKKYCKCTTNMVLGGIKTQGLRENIAFRLEMSW